MRYLSLITLCLLFSLLANANNESIVKDFNPIFICNNIKYPVDQLEKIGIKTTNTVGIFGRGETISNTYKATNGLSFGVDVTKYNDTDWTTVNGWVKNNTGKTLTLDSIIWITDCVLPCDNSKNEKLRVLCGNTDRLVWTDQALKNGDKTISALTFLGIYNPQTSEEYTMGYSITKAWGSFTCTINPKDIGITASTYYDVDIKPGATYTGEALHIKKGKVWNDLCDLVAATGKEANAQTGAQPFGGWCSWYGFNPFMDNDITQDVVLDIINGLSEIKGFNKGLVLLDDGYFTLPGDWTTIRPTFPNGMRYLTEECKAKGLIPGIWIAPNTVHENSEIMKKAPYWVDRNAKGGYQHEGFGNWGGHTYTFDLTNPEFLQHTDTLFDRIANDWGYRYLKIDFNCEAGPCRQDRSITGFESMRNFYRRIQNAVGDSVFIANCYGGPYPPSVGIARAGRVGPDVNPHWESVISGCRSSLLHQPFHNRWWTNDPDCLNMREARTSLTDDELITHVTANFMGGGYILFSDSIQELTPSRKRLLSLALPPSGKAAEIVDYMQAPDQDLPSTLYYPVNKFGEKSVIATIFNWSNDKNDASVEFTELGLDKNKDYYVYDFWNDELKGIFNNKIELVGQRPHSCSLLAIRPVKKGKIQIISTDLHMLQGEKEITGLTNMNTSPFDGAKDEVWIEITPQALTEGKLVLAADDGLRIASAQGTKSKLEKRIDGLWDLHLWNMKDKVAIVLRVR